MPLMTTGSIQRHHRSGVSHPYKWWPCHSVQIVTRLVSSLSRDACRNKGLATSLTKLQTTTLKTKTNTRKTNNANQQWNRQRETELDLKDFDLGRLSPVFKLDRLGSFKDPDEDEQTATTVESFAPQSAGNVWSIAAPPLGNAWRSPVQPVTKNAERERGLKMTEIQAEQKAKQRQPKPYNMSRAVSTKYVPPSGRGFSSLSGGSPYVPPSGRGFSGWSEGRGKPLPAGGDQPLTRIRVVGLSDSTTEVDLEHLTRPFGRISRIHIVKDRETCKPRGFAFVTFTHGHEAARALEGLNGYGYDHRILHVDWAKPRENRSMPRMSGYGKPLPQSLQAGSWRGLSHVHSKR